MKALEILTDDPEQFMATIAGSATNSILHPKRLVSTFVKAGVVGFFLAEFVSPAVAERLQLSRNEAIALSFVCGYAGCRVINTGEDVLLKRIQAMGGIEGISTDSSKASVTTGATSEGAEEGDGLS